MRVRFEAASAKSLETMSSNEEKHLFVFVHGLGGSEDDLLALATELLNRDKNNVILRVTCNTPMRSFDGVIAGGERIVDEVESFVEEYDAKRKGPLAKISFVGNSMGGLYCRYVLTRLYERETKTILGMEMHTFLTTATPHLGVGEYGYFELVPGPLRMWAGEGLGQSIKDLALFDVEETGEGADEMPLLARMTIDDDENNMYFIEALSAFRRRCAFANAANDFLVSYETASIRHEKLSRRQEAEWASLNTGPTVVFNDVIRLEDRKAGGLAEVQPTAPLRERMEKLVKKNGRVGNERWTKFMEHGLRSAGPWRHVDVSFPGPLPIAHNKIVALQRNAMTAKLFKEGEVIEETSGVFDERLRFVACNYRCVHFRITTRTTTGTLLFNRTSIHFVLCDYENNHRFGLFALKASAMSLITKSLSSFSRPPFSTNIFSTPLRNTMA